MWQFAMNFPGKEDRRAGFGGGNHRGGRFLVMACFTALAVLHIAGISLFGFFAKSERPFTETRELFLTLDLAASPEEPAAAAATALPPVPLPREEVPSPAPRALPEEEAAPASPDSASPAETVLPAAPLPASAVHSGDAAPPVSGQSASGRTMTDAEYLALIMGRLEKNKIYPLAVRKRGIEGDIMAAFTIRRDGTVADMKLMDPAGHRFLAQAAFETIRSASPFPVREGREGEYTVQVNIRYRLED
jgi:TonB family protein